MILCLNLLVKSNDFAMIKKCTLFLILITVTIISGQAQVRFGSYFQNQSLRIDYLLAGTDTSEQVLIRQMKKEPHFAGSHSLLIDEREYGTYRYLVFDLKSDSLIFSKGFCPLFQEWQTTLEASAKTGSYYQVAIIPFPKREIRFSVEKRNEQGEFIPIYSEKIDPKNYFIVNENLSDYKALKVQTNGNPKSKVDLVFLPEGYTKAEMDKFMLDVERMCKSMFKNAPFDKLKDQFNIYAVQVPSVESGTDIPGDGVYKNTAFNSTFYTFDTPRYLTSSDMKSIHDAAALVPYDHIYVLVNTDRYGGGGFYNFLSLTSVDHEKSERVFVHEFGHGFAGLADEYYSSSVAYDDFYNLDIEPWEPNITTLVDFESKWPDLIKKNTPQPTPRKSENSKKIGVFEGGGYLAKGIYSPMMNCRMKSNEAKGFCPVCEQAVKETIEQHCK